MASKIKLASSYLKGTINGKNVDIKTFGSKARRDIESYDSIYSITTGDPALLLYALEFGKLPERKNLRFHGKNLPEEVELYYRLQ